MKENKIPYLVENEDRDTFTFYIKGTKPYLELQQENKQLKEQLENDIDRYEDTISYQLGFDKGKEYLQQRIDKAIEILHAMKHCELLLGGNKKSNIDKLIEILGDKENE